MKKINYFIMVIVTIFMSLSFSACSSDDKDAKSLIVGTWEETGSYFSWTITFKADGTFQDKWVFEDEEPDSSSGSYSLIDNDLYLDYTSGDWAGEKDKVRVLELTSKKLVLDVEYYDYGPGEEIETFYKK